MSAANLTLSGVALACIGAIITLIAFRQAAPSATDVVAERLDAFQHGEQLLSLDAEEAAQPFTQRVIAPTLNALGGALARRTPEAARVRLQHDLSLAGHPLGLGTADFLATRYVCAALGGLGGAALGLFMGRSQFAFLGAALCGVIGLRVPLVLLSTRVKRARKELQRTLPDAMDLMSVCVEAGLTFEAAMARVSERFDNALGAEFAKVQREIRLGRYRRDAIADLGARSGVDEVQSFTQAVIQSEQLGTGIARVLRVQSDDLRERRRQRAQEKGAQATVKMLFPMIIFIFPALWIVLLGPAGLLLLRQFGGAR